MGRSVLMAAVLIARMLSDTLHANAYKGLPSKIRCFGIIVLLL